METIVYLISFLTASECPPMIRARVATAPNPFRVLIPGSTAPAWVAYVDLVPGWQTVSGDFACARSARVHRVEVHGETEAEAFQAGQRAARGWADDKYSNQA